MEHSGLKLGLMTPIVSDGGSQFCGDWVNTAGLRELEILVRRADELGYSHMTCSEHVFMVESELGRRGPNYWDPLSTFGYFAAITEQIRFATHVLVLGYHHPLEIAKRYGTLDMISGGRVTLGLGVGSMQEEFELLGAPFEDRGARADDAMRCLRASLSKRSVSYKGPYYEFEDLIIEPHAVQPTVPMWVGGRSRRSLRRALELGDGWAPFWLSNSEIREMLDTVDLPAGFDVVLEPVEPLDPIGRPEETEAALAAVAAAGATICTPILVSRSLQHHLEQLDALAS